MFHRSVEGTIILYKLTVAIATYILPLRGRSSEVLIEKEAERIVYHSSIRGGKSGVVHKDAGTKPSQNETIFYTSYTSLTLIIVRVRKYMTQL